MALEYEARSSMTKRPAAYYVLLAWNCIGIMIGTWVCWSYRESIGDSYGPLLGIFYGVPIVAVSLLLFSLPTLVVRNRIGTALDRVSSMCLWLADAVAVSIPTVMTVLLVVMPRTHGGNC